MVNLDNSNPKNFPSQLKQFALSESRILSSILAVSMFICMLLYTLQRSYNPFVHDSAYYWDLANSFVVNDNFSIFNFHNELRGFFFPLLLFVIQALAALLHIDGKTLFYIFSSLFFTTLSVNILPWFTNTLFGWKKHLTGKALLGILIFFFWRGHFLYPLSDFPAFTALLIGTTLLILTLRNNSISSLSIFAGFFLCVATNIRPIYLISLVILIPSALVFLWMENRQKSFQWLAFFLLGCSIILAPQYFINRIHFNINSSLVLAKYGGEESLYAKQLFWGLGTQKFETNIGTEFPSIVVLYSDPFKSNLRGTNLLKEKTLASYIDIVRHFPLDIAVSYFRHTFNGLDIFFPTPYVKNVYANHTFLSVVNYLVWLIVVRSLLNSDFPKRNFLCTASVIGLLSPVILSIPTVIEVRFFLPAHLLAYGGIAFGLNLQNEVKPLLENKKGGMQFIIVSIIWVILCFALSTTTIENMSY